MTVIANLYCSYLGSSIPFRLSQAILRKMEAIKNAIGLGSSQVQSGQEPISGVTGSGTASEPYDGGNATGKFYWA